jgi:GTPase
VTIHGNTTGLKPGAKRALERLGQRRVPASRVVTPELAHSMALVSAETGRQVGLFIDRGGQVVQVAVGDASKIDLPDFGRLRAAEARFRGLRLVHTHLRSEPLSRDDLTDLTRLRLDMVVAVGVDPEGRAGAVYLAHLLPPSLSGELTRQLGPLNLGAIDIDFLELIGSLEEEFRKEVRGRRVDMPSGRAVLVHVSTDRRRAAEAERSLDELAELSRTAGVEVADRIVQFREKPDRLYVMGRGKLEEVVIRARQKDAELLILDCDIGANQARAIGDLTDLKVIDRTQLILDIFAQHALSTDGKLQVELAQLKYLLPRLGARDDALSRLTGGIGGRGPGETKLEIGRRRARDRVSRLEQRLEQLSRARSQRRAKRQRSGVPVVSIIGYTNAGKSTLLNQLTRSDVLVEDKLFATLDPASRRLRFPREREIVVTDTVGFIRDLPKELLAAFKATLEELDDARLLLHVIDASDPSFKDQIRWVEETLMDLDLHGKDRLLVLNKCDRVPQGVVAAEAAQMGAVALSAVDRNTFGPLMEAMEVRLWPDEDDPALSAGRS